MRLASPGRWSRLVVVPAALALLGASCSKPSESREVADRFMELYYARMKVAEAVKLCSGAARTKLEGELRAIQGVAPDAGAGEPRVTFELTAANPSPTQATYTYRVTPHTADVRPVTAMLTLDNEDGHWHVTTFNEGAETPAS